ncbi:hypothetical protein [Planomonospora parontospora]|uniref:hypothetical protein n=1 Tax=Planomonospora parontospora TaxID=58119 RepID=UPI0016717A42|nr:hypothetical protein [Planomonospora parontospora]GGL49253.1 hypothetical protein GCM10014719_58090 [Planomonospora parontospora subsp. antibiotica]GII18948.1 hypothetical protein Ppa05_56740 [Planomonospora parontospora subsp. antibiotica]
MSHHLRLATATAFTGLGLLLAGPPASAQPGPDLPELPGFGGWTTSCECFTGPGTPVNPTLVTPQVPVAPQAPAAPQAPTAPSMPTGEDDGDEAEEAEDDTAEGSAD